MYRQTFVMIALLGVAAPAAAQVDPLLFLKRSAPNVLVMVDTGNRMQRDAPTDPANPIATSNYYDPLLYPFTGSADQGTLGVTSATAQVSYRRRYNNLTPVSGGTDDKFSTSSITAVGDQQPGYSLFEAPTRMSVVRAALYQAIQENQNLVRFGLYKMRQSNPQPASEGNSGPVADADVAQLAPTDVASNNGRWRISRPTVSASNGTVSGGLANTQSWVIKTADANSGNQVVTNSQIQSALAIDTRALGGLLPAGQDDANTIDEPVQHMVDDLKTEAGRLIDADVTASLCRNTVAVLITGGGEGTTTAGADPVAAATAMMSLRAGRRIPIIVIAIAPPSADVAQLRQIAANSGGQYFEISRQNIRDALDAASRTPVAYPPQAAVPGTVVVPEMVRAVNVAVQTAFQEFSDLNTQALWSGPWLGWKGYSGSLGNIPSSEFQVTSPIVGTVNLENGKDINGNALSNTIVYDKASNKIPQRSNLLVTTGFTLPGFDGILRGFRVYVPVVDASQPSGYKFVSNPSPAQEKRLWIASVPDDRSRRNLYTALADGTVVAFTEANAATLAPLMHLSVLDATAVIESVRQQPLGAVIDSTPAVMNPPSLDPPPDDEYPAFAVANKNRRSIIWVGTNRGILEGIDARLGVEVWGFIPLNLLPKLKTIRDGQPVEKFDYFVDGSPKVADVKIDGVWKTYLIMGEGPGGTFLQTFDVTMSDMNVAPDSDDLTAVLNYFANPAKIRLAWSFPRYSTFDPTWTSTTMPYGDLSISATAIEKSVGQTWSDPAVGQVANSSSPYTVLVGSGFLPYSTQQQTNRAGAIAGTTFYVLNVKDGTVLSSRNVGNDGKAETTDVCGTSAQGCTQIKNALQSDPVATGPADSRFMTKAYIGDLDGRVWRFDLNLDASFVPTIAAPIKIFESGDSQPIISSLAAVNVSGQQYIFFGTGSDLLPLGQMAAFHLYAVNDTGSGAGLIKFDRPLAKTATTFEVVTAFPAVAGDIVFFTTTTTKTSPCTTPDANLYAFTFIGGPAYDNSGDNAVTANKDTPLVKTVAGARATAPFIVDQHLVFGAGGKIEQFGDPADYNNGIGQAGVRILSWRQVK